MQAAVEGLGVGGSIRSRVPHQGDERFAVDVLKDGQGREVEQRLRYVRLANRGRYPPSSLAAVREPDHQGNVQRLAIEKHAMLLLSVIAEPLSVIRGNGDDRMVVTPHRPQGVEEPAHDLVGVGDIAVVGRGVARMPARRIVGRVRFVQVEKREHRPLRAGESVGKGLRGQGAVPLLVPQGRVAASGDGVVILVEALGDAGPLAKDERGNGAKGCVSLRLEGFGYRPLPAQGIAEIVAHPVMRGQQRGEKRRVGRQGQRDMTVGVFEHYRAGCEGIQVRGESRLRTVSAQAIRPQGVDRNEDDRGALGLDPRTSATGAQGRSQQGQDSLERVGTQGS